MDGIWHDSFYWKIREYTLADTTNWEELKDVIDARRQGYKNLTDIVNYNSNHDHDRLLVDLGKENQIFDEDAFRRVRMAFTLQATSYGLMMIWMGAEIGEYKEKTSGVAKLDWSLIEDREDNSNAINKQQLKYYKDIIQLRKVNLALTTPNLEFIFEHVNDRIMAWYRWNSSIDDSHKQDNHVIVICNWSSSTYETYEILNIPQNGRWYEWLNDNKEYFVENNKLIVDNFLDHTVRILIYEIKKKMSKTFVRLNRIMCT
jgi:1,4-alpha-glucan branching enzyme